MTSTLRSLGLEGTSFWWYSRVYTKGFSGADPLVGHLLPPLLAEARSRGIERWFFIRYVDPHGPHIRLRVLAEQSVLDHLHRVQDDLCGELADLQSGIRPRHVFVAPIDREQWEGRQGVGSRTGVYEPEIEKYGGQAGQSLAESVFEFSSDLAMWACAQLDKESSRAALAVLLLSDAATVLTESVGTADPAASWQRYWDHHLAWWTMDMGPKAPAGRAALRQVVEAHGRGARRRISDVERLPSVSAWRHQWRIRVGAYLDAAAKAGVSRSPEHLTFHQNHMMMNRLGFLPREEAVLGIHARGAHD
jgi:thiopeptide-type bacteriocin biosynthesis protein